MGGRRSEVGDEGLGVLGGVTGVTRAVNIERNKVRPVTNGVTTRNTRNGGPGPSDDGYGARSEKCRQLVRRVVYQWDRCRQTRQPTRQRLFSTRQESGQRLPTGR